jgi:hypothetical protein
MAAATPVSVFSELAITGEGDLLPEDGDSITRRRPSLPRFYRSFVEGFVTLFFRDEKLQPLTKATLFIMLATEIGRFFFSRMAL